jgi:hypothetical protein
MKVGDLVRITRYGSRFAPDGTIGIIIEKLPIPEPKARHYQTYSVRCLNGHIARHANFCLEVISADR